MIQLSVSQLSEAILLFTHPIFNFSSRNILSGSCVVTTFQLNVIIQAAGVEVPTSLLAQNSLKTVRFSAGNVIYLPVITNLFTFISILLRQIHGEEGCDVTTPGAMT